MKSTMASDLTTGQNVGQRNIPAGLIDEAYQHVYEAAIRTPLVRLNYDGPAEIYLKLECLQPIGSFKIRGAYNAVRKLPEQQRRHGVWTVSAGNAAQGVALAARKAGVPCQVLVIDAAPAAKLDAARRLGAELVKASYDDCWKALADRSHPAMTGAFVHPFEDDDFIAGNASVGLEILEDLPEVDAIVAASWPGSAAEDCPAELRLPSKSAEVVRKYLPQNRRRRHRWHARWRWVRRRSFPIGKPVGWTAAAASRCFPACGSSRITCSPVPLFLLSRRPGRRCASWRCALT
jgi:hypothetical protein